ncbi:MAG: DoxX family protein [Acidimicrobiia bacterium]|nr:DoxX family protein [Acidimicrobiia bacterium]
MTRPVVQWIPTIVRFGAGAVFVGAGAFKFHDHAQRVVEFRRFEVPLPGLAVPAVGVVELAAGALLVVGWIVRPSAIALALTMVGVLLTAGRAVGGRFRLVYAPALLVLMIFLIWAGPGRMSVDGYRDARRRYRLTPP